MTENYISFPKLGITLHLDNVAFTLGSKEIYWYGIIIGIGFFAAIVAAVVLAKKYGVSPDVIYDVALYGAPSAIICARIYYVVFNWQSYAHDLSEIYKIWHGGIAIYGAIIGGVVSTVVYCRKKNQNLPLVCDIGAVGLLIGQICGRWGNFFNQEAFGINTDSLFGMTGNVIKERLSEMVLQGAEVNPELCVHPTFLYESLWNTAVLIVVLLLFKRRRFDGQVFLTYVSLYGLGRFFVEGLRTDSLYLGGIRISQAVAAITFFAAAFAVVYCIVKKKGSLTPSISQKEQI